MLNVTNIFKNTLFIDNILSLERYLNRDFTHFYCIKLHLQAKKNSKAERGFGLLAAKPSETRIVH